MITALDLMVGDRVADNFTAWAEVAAVTREPGGVRVEWLLADGKAETTLYEPDAEFILLDHYPDPWSPGGKFIESGLHAVDD